MLTHWLPITSILFRIVTICRSLFKCDYLKKENFSLNFLFNWWNIYQILNIFAKKKIVIANVFLRLQTLKDLVRPLSKKRRFRTSFDIQHVKVSQTLVKSLWEDFYHIFSALWREMMSRISALLKFENIGVFVNILTANYKYPVPDCENLSFPFEMQLS